MVAVSELHDDEEFDDGARPSWNAEYLEDLHIPNGAIRRIIIIDGCNVVPTGAEIGRRIKDIKGKTHKPTARSLLMMVHKFMAAGFEVYVTLKSYYVNGPKSDHAYIYDMLVDLGIAQIVDAPLDDDAVILHTAEEYGGAVVSRDLYRNQCYTVYDETSKRRLIPFKFNPPILCRRESLHEPQNLFSWSTDLSFSNLSVALAHPYDKDYEMVKKKYGQMRRSTYMRDTYAIIRVLNEYFHYEICYQTPGCQTPVLPYFSGPLNGMKYTHFLQFYNQHLEKLRRSHNPADRREAETLHFR